MNEDFSTIEHDFIHTKDYFNNCKFNYKERRSKLDFFQNINNSTVQDTADLLNEAKSQLVSVKGVYTELDTEIKNLSQELHEYNCKTREQVSFLEELTAEKKEQDLRAERLKELYEKFQESADLNNELDGIESEIKRLYRKIDEYKAISEGSKLSALRQEETDLGALQKELAIKQKRLTIINTDSYIEDIYYWYDTLSNFLESIFGALSLKLVKQGLLIQITVDQAHLEAVVRDNKLAEASLQGQVTEQQQEAFIEAKNFSIQTNNLLLLVERVFFH